MRAKIHRFLQRTRPTRRLVDEALQRSSDFRNRKIAARIPHQSKIGSEEPIFDSFPPGEAMGAAAPDQPFFVYRGGYTHDNCGERNDVALFYITS